MAGLPMCPACKNEYDDIDDRRHHSQTNSCPDCSIPLSLFDRPGHVVSESWETALDLLCSGLREGKTAAIKGTGGYLLICDAGNPEAIAMLRKRKHRPHKPFALLCRDMAMAEKLACVTSFEKEALQDAVAPIVLCRMHDQSASVVDIQGIAPGLDKLGIMLPNSALLYLLARAMDRPLVATSANLSGSPILFRDEDALADLWDFADFILVYDRDILAPQDDSVWQFTCQGQRIILRRGRGMAPDYFPNPLPQSGGDLVAMGADLKATLGIQNREKVFISQFLGNLESYPAQVAYGSTFRQLDALLKFNPRMVICDLHPGYQSRAEGLSLANRLDIPVISVQHHEAHGAAVLAENNLMDSVLPVLVCSWDGTGYGTDGQIWGGEFFLYKDHAFERIGHLDYFQQLLGNKMSLEPRLSVLSLLRNHASRKQLLEHYFSPEEWDYYNKLTNQDTRLLTSSMGRYLDALASLLGLCQVNSYEGQAPLRLEVLARRYQGPDPDPYPWQVNLNRIDFSPMLEQIIRDLLDGLEKSLIAKRIFRTLVRLVAHISAFYETDRIAFSGGVFQNELLTGMLIRELEAKKELYFHRQLSPNDECIAFGQLVMAGMRNKTDPGSLATASNGLQLADQP
jgi:hydrogenase maturation protein HypF